MATMPPAIEALLLSEIDDQKIIYVNNDATIILGDNEAVGEVEETVIEDDQVACEYVESEEQTEMHMVTRQNEDDSNVFLQQDMEEIKIEQEEVTLEDDEQIFQIIKSDNEVVTQVILTDEQCRMLQDYGSVVLQQGAKQYLLDGEGLKEITDSMEDSCLLTDMHKDKAILDPVTGEFHTDEVPAEPDPRLEEFGELEEVLEEQVSEELLQQEDMSLVEHNAEGKQEQGDCKYIFVEVPIEEGMDAIKLKKGKHGIKGEPREGLKYTDMEMGNEYKCEKAVYLKYNPARRKHKNCSRPGTGFSLKDRLPPVGTKIYVGRTKQGKKLFAKILAVQPPGSKKVKEDPLNLNKILATKDSSRCSIDESTSANILDDADMESIRDGLLEDMKEYVTVFKITPSQQLMSPPTDTPETEWERSASIQKVFSILMQIPHLIKLLTRRNLMLVKVVKDEALKKEYSETGRMQQQAGSHEWVYTNRHDLLLPHKYQQASSAASNFLLIKILVLVEGDSAVTRIYIMDSPRSGHSKLELGLAAAGSRARQRRLQMDANQFQCRFCEKRFQRQTAHDRHLQTHVDPTYELEDTEKKKKCFKCPHCPCAYAFPSTLTRHIMASHVNLTDKDTQYAFF